MISMQLSQRIIGLIVFLSAVISGAIFYFISHGGAVSFEAAVPAINKLIGIYGPILGIIAGFYASNEKIKNKKLVPKDSFYFALFFVGVGLLVPPFILAVSETIEAATRLLEIVAGIPTTLASGFLVFFYTKNSK